MGRIIKVTNRSEFEEALKVEGAQIHIHDSGLYVVSSGSPHIVSWGTSSPHIESWGTSSPHIVSWETSSPHIESWGTSSPHIVSRETSSPHIVSWGTSSPHIVSRETSSPHIVSWETSSPHIVSRETSSPHIVSWGTSSPHIESRGTSSPHIVSRETSSPHIVSWGTSSPRGSAGKFSALIVTPRGTGKIDIPGALLLPVPTITTPAEWCEYYGAEVKDGVATLYKAVSAEYRSGYKFSYEPGTTPEAPDWDGGERECGGGLHFCSSPSAALVFYSDAEKFVACPVALEDLVVHPDAQYPHKIKGRKICLPIYEVDITGERIQKEQEPKEIFVFGSNLGGNHAGGAAKFAAEKLGAQFGVGEGKTGDTYALPTLNVDFSKRSLGEISASVGVFIKFARERSDLRFKVTRVGCGIAGFSDEDIAPMFFDAPANCLFDSHWEPHLLGKKFWGSF